MTIYNIDSFFIYYCLYCLHHNVFAYIVCWYLLKQGKQLVQTGGLCKILSRLSLSNAIQKRYFLLLK